MTKKKKILRPIARPPKSKNPTHLFEVGQAVRLMDGIERHASSSDIYHITATLPPSNGSLQYRIRCHDEPHERVATQYNLEPVNIPLSGDENTLTERTFGHGQGTKEK